MLVKDNMSLGKRLTVAHFTGMLLILSLLLQCAVFTAAAVNANTSKSDSVVNGTHFDNRSHSAVASKSVTNAKSAIKPATTGVKPVKPPPKEPLKPTNNNGKPAEPSFSALSKVNNAGNTHTTSKNNHTAKTVKAKNTDHNDILKSNVTSSKAVKIKGAATKINGTSPISKINETTTKAVGLIQKTTVYPILDEAESMFWSSEDDSPDDVPDTKPTVDAPATSKEGIKSLLMDLPEPINNPEDAFLELLAEGGSGETTEATEPTTTTPVPTTTTTPVPTTTVPTTTTVLMTTTGLTATVPPTYENVDPNFGMNFDLSIQVAYDDYLEDPDDERYIALETEVEGVINKAFHGCWGFVENSARVLDFYNATWRGQITKGTDPVGYSHNSPELLVGEGFDSTGANYNVTFETAKVFEHPDWVFDFISKNATYILEDSTIANSSVSAGDMTQDAQDQIKDLTTAPCQVLACPSCYQCSENPRTLGNDSTNTAQCGFLCKSATEQCSIVDNSNGIWVGECTCKKGYLPIGDDCASEDVVIGVSVGIGLFIILVILIIFIILYRKYTKKDKEKDKESDSEAPIDAYQEAPIPEDSKRESSAEEVASPSAPLDHDLTEGENIRPVTSPTVEAEISRPREEERGEDEEVMINFQPNLSNVDDEYLSRNYAIARARVSSPSLDGTQDYLHDNFFF